MVAQVGAQGAADGCHRGGVVNLKVDQSAPAAAGDLDQLRLGFRFLFRFLRSGGIRHNAFIYSNDGGFAPPPAAASFSDLQEIDGMTECGIWIAV